MNFRSPKLSYLALSIGVAVAASANSASIDKVSLVKAGNTDGIAGAMVQAQNNKAEYLVVLTDKAALDASYRAKGQKYKTVANDIAQSHVQLQNEILALDGNAKVLARTQLLSNTMIVAMGASKIEALKSNGLVESVIHLRTLDDNEFANLQPSSRQLTNEDEDTLVKDYSGVEGVKVGIISTGLDYTHEAIGGAGTIEAYADAMAMAPIDFTPTDTVFGGIDLMSENYGADYNPIESNVEYTNEWSGEVFPTGKGTQLASLVLKHAPDAKLFPIKVFGITYDAEQDYTDARWPWRKTAEALEYVVDPNGDGDISDRLDVVLIDAMTVTEDGNYWFFGVDDKTTSSPAIQQYFNNILSNAGAWGTLVVTDTGMDMLPDEEKAGGNEYVYNLAGAGTVANALTVGSAMMDKEVTRVTDFTRIGPVRWSENQKPDLVAPSVELEVAMAGTANGMGVRTDSAAAAAVMTGKVAKLMAERPNLSAQEIKSLLVNTADHNVMKLASDDMEDITRAGAGMPNVDAAAMSPVVAWERDSFQPWLSFGFVEGQKQFKLVKEISVRNLSDEEQTYEVGVAQHKDNPGLSWQYPQSVTVPAGHTVSFPVELSVEPTLLNSWPIKLAEDHTVENYYAAAYTGFVTLNQADQPQVDIGWRVLPRSKDGIVKDHFSYQEHYYSPWNPDAGWTPMESILGQNYWGHRQQFVNDSSKARTFAAYPGIVSQSDADRLPTARNANGIMIKSVGGGIFDDISGTCSSGKKLSIAATFEQPLDIAVAYHPDKPSTGYDVLGMSVLTEAFVVANGLDENHHTGYYPQDTDIAMNLWVAMDNNHQPVAWFTDYNKTFDRTNPAGRNTQSSLGVTLSGHGTNLVAEWCVDDLYHSKEGYDADWNPITITYDSPESFDASFGWMFATDRDTAPATNNGNPMPLFNPTIYGHTSQLEVSDWFGNTFTIEIDGTFSLTMNKVAEEGSDVELSNMVTLAPGESAYVNAFWKENEAGVQLDHQMMLVSLDDNFNLNSSILVGNDADGADPSIRAGQVFNVAENTENGTELGRILLDSEAFFASWSEEYPADIVVMNSIPGSPITVTSAGYVVVSNSDALDYENLQEFDLELGVMAGSRINSTGFVKVMVGNVDDTAPAYGETDAGILADVTIDAGTEFNVNLADYFTDADGSVLTFNVEGLPAGMSFDANTGVISGAPTEAGDYTVVVTASDGNQSTSTEFAFSVTEVVEPVVESGGSSSGSTAPLWLSLVSLLALMRRRNK